MKLACRCSTADLDNERGAVMEEWRSGKDSRGRVAEAQWKMVMQGTKVHTQLACPALLSCCQPFISACSRSCHLSCRLLSLDFPSHTSFEECLMPSHCPPPPFQVPPSAPHPQIQMLSSSVGIPCHRQLLQVALAATITWLLIAAVPSSTYSMQQDANIPMQIPWEKVT